MTPLDVPQQPEDQPPSLPGTESYQAALPVSIPVPHRGEEPARRGPKAEPVSDKAGPCHKAWLLPLRGGSTAAGYTLGQLASLTGYSKTRISTLPRGAEYYPSWELTYSVIHVLSLPVLPLRRLWTAGAREADKNQTWIEERIRAVRPPAPEGPPIAYQAFTETMREPYTNYARALLQNQGASWLVSETFDLLWLEWDAAASSPDVRRYAWLLLRQRVLRCAHRHRDGRPDLRPAAFSTVTQSIIRTPRPASRRSVSSLTSSETSVNCPRTTRHRRPALPVRPGRRRPARRPTGSRMARRQNSRTASWWRLRLRMRKPPRRSPKRLPPVGRASPPTAPPRAGERNGPMGGGSTISTGCPQAEAIGAGPAGLVKTGQRGRVGVGRRWSWQRIPVAEPTR